MVLLEEVWPCWRRYGVGEGMYDLVGGSELTGESVSLILLPDNLDIELSATALAPCLSASYCASMMTTDLSL